MTASRLILLTLPLLLAELGCTVTAVSQAEDPRPSNSCNSASDCKGDSFCGQGICQTPNGKIESLLLAATPPSDSLVAHLTYTTQLTDLPTRGAGDPLVFPGPIQVAGSLSLPPSTCYPTFVSTDLEHPILAAPDGVSLPVSVTFAPHERLLGLPQPLYYASAKTLNGKGGYTFEVQVPSGHYDIYLVPPPLQQACQVPPQLYRNKLIDSKSASVLLPLKLLPVSELNVAVHFPDPLDGPGLRGWLVDIIEQVSGDVISTAVALGDPSRPPSGKTQTVVYSAQLRYSLVDGEATRDDGSAIPTILRLRPPPGTVAPTLIFDRTGFGLFDPEQADITGFNQYPTAVSVQGQLARHDTGAPLGGDVELVSMSITGVDEGMFPSYQTSVHVEDDGLFQVQLPPGQYVVRAAPTLAGEIDSSTDAVRALETTWMVPAEPPVQSGKLLELLPSLEITGESSVQGAVVQAASASLPASIFDDAFGKSPFTPRATSGLVDESGHFAVQADPGRFHVSVQPPEFLGFAWFVRPGVQVANEDQDLGSATLRAPASLFGPAQLDDGGAAKPLGSASIRAYAYLDKDLAYTRDPKLAVSVIQVAQTHADESGAFRLLIPPSLSPK